MESAVIVTDNLYYHFCVMNFHQRLLEGVIFFSQKLSDFSCTDWSRAMLKKTTDHGNLRVSGAICLSLSSTCNFPKNFNRNGHQKLSNVMVKTN